MSCLMTRTRQNMIVSCSTWLERKTHNPVQMWRKNYFCDSIGRQSCEINSLTFEMSFVFRVKSEKWEIYFLLWWASKMLCDQTNIILRTSRFDELQLNEKMDMATKTTNGKHRHDRWLWQSSGQCFSVACVRRRHVKNASDLLQSHSKETWNTEHCQKYTHYDAWY